MTQSQTAELDALRAQIIKANLPSIDDETARQLARAIRDGDENIGVITVPKRPTIRMVFEAQQMTPDIPEFDAIADRAFEWYEAMLMAAIGYSPYRYVPQNLN